MTRIATSQARGAEIVARNAHEHQLDKAGHPYVLHLEAVAAQVTGDEMKAAAWLHDIIEDTPVGPQDLRNMGFNDDVVEAVLLLTHTHESTREEYLVRIRDAKGYAGELARAVKAADIRHNMSEERALPGKEGERMRKRYIADFALLTEGDS
jgi:(p)ppGpp synthase/HD superfamily hydrolase